MSRLIVFDFDNTIADYGFALNAAYRELSGAIPARGSEDAARSLIAIVQGNASPEGDPWGGDGSPRIPDVMALAEDLIAGMDYRLPLVKGAAECLSRLAANRDNAIAIMSARSDETIRRILEAHALQGRVELSWFRDIRGGTYASQNGFETKPHPGLLQDLMRKTGCDAECSVVVGDSVHDHVMAGYLGVPSIAFVYAPGQEELLLRCGAVIAIRDYAELDDAAISRVMAEHALKRRRAAPPGTDLPGSGERARLRIMGVERFCIGGNVLEKAGRPSYVKIGIGSLEENGFNVPLAGTLSHSGGENQLDGWYRELVLEVPGPGADLRFEVSLEYFHTVFLVWWPDVGVPVELAESP